MTELEIVKINLESLELRWMPINSECVSGYRVMLHQSSNIVREEIIPPPHISSRQTWIYFNLKNLSPLSVYNISVQAFSVKDEGNKSWLTNVLINPSTYINMFIMYI